MTSNKFVDKDLSGYEVTKTRKPVVHGPVDGNIFAVMAAASKAMRKEKVSHETIEQMMAKVMKSGSYGKALMVVADYVEFDL